MRGWDRKNPPRWSPFGITMLAEWLQTEISCGGLSFVNTRSGFPLYLPRTSDSLNEVLPIKMTREKFQRKLYFFYEKDSRFNPRLISTKPFSHWTSTNWKIWVENSVFAIQNIENRKKLYWSAPPPRDQTNPLAYSCSFTFHTSYKNGMIGHGGNAVKMLKTI